MIFFRAGPKAAMVLVASDVLYVPRKGVLPAVDVISLKYSRQLIPFLGTPEVILPSNGSCSRGSQTHCLSSGR